MPVQATDQLRLPTPEELQGIEIDQSEQLRQPTPEELQNIEIDQSEQLRTPTAEELQGIDIEPSYEGSQVLRPLTDRERAELDIEEPPKTIWDRAKTVLAQMSAAAFGRTPELESQDVKALLSADPSKVNELFDEDGQLTKQGETAWQDLGRGVDQLQQFGINLGMLGADLVGADDLFKSLLPKFEKQQAEIAANPPIVGSYKDIFLPGQGVLSGVRRATTYGRQAVFQNVPSMLPSLVLGGVGGLVAKKVISRGLSKAALDRALQAGQAGAKKIAATQLAGTVTGATGIEAGSIYGDMVDRGVRGPVPAMVAFGSGLVAGSFEGVLPFLVIRRAGGAPIKGPIDKLVRSTLGTSFMEKGVARLGVPAFEGALTEGATEYLQTAIELAAVVSQDPKAQGKRLDAFWNGYEQYQGLKEQGIEAALQGAIAGGVLNLGGTAIGAIRDKLGTVADKQFFDLGIQAAVSKMGQPVQVQFDTPSGLITLPVDAPAAAIQQRAQRQLPAQPGVEGAQIVTQALDQGLSQTAAAVAEVMPQPVAAAPEPTGAAVIPEVDIPPPSPTPSQGAAAPLAPPPLTQEVPATPGVTQPAPQAVEAIDQTAPAAPAAVPEAPGVAEASEAIQTPQEAQVTPPAPPVAPEQAPEAPPGPIEAAEQTLPDPFTLEGMAVRRVIDEEFPNLSFIEVADSAADFPEDVKQKLFEKGSNPDEVDGFFYRGRVILNAATFPTDNPARVRQKVVHEAAIHLGLRSALGEQLFSRLSNQVWKSLTPAERAEISNRNHISPENREVIGEEFLAYEAERVVEQGHSNSIWAKIAAGIRAVLREFRIPLKLSDFEIARLINRGLRQAAEPGVQEEFADLRESVTPRTVINRPAKRVKGWTAERRVGTQKEGPSLGTYITSNLSVAEHLSAGEGKIIEQDIEAKPLVIPANQRLGADKKPVFDYFSLDEVNQRLKEAGVRYKFDEDEFDDFANFWEILDEGGKKLTRAVEKAGYDSIQYPEFLGGVEQTTTLVFKPPLRNQQAAEAAMNLAAKNVPRETVGEETVDPPDPIAEPTVGGGPVIPQTDPDIKEADEAYTRFSISPVTISNADVNQVLQTYGLPGLREMLGNPDAELWARVQDKIANVDGWIKTIVERETKKPGLLSDEETLGLDYTLLQLRSRYEQQANLEQAATQAGDETQATIHRQNVQKAGQDIQQLAEITQKAGSAAGRAFRARQLAVGFDFSLQRLINQKREAVGWRQLTDAEIRKLQKTASEYQRLNQKLQQQNEELRARDVDKEIQAARGELAQANPQVVQLAKEWVDSYDKRAGLAKDRFQNKWKRLFPDQPLRTSVAPGVPTLPENMLSELAIIGGSKLAANITEEAAWNEAMVRELGEGIRPYLAQARAAADAHFQAELANGRQEIQARRPPRRKKPGEKRPPTVGEEIELARLKIGETLELQRDTAEPTTITENELFNPVQRLVRLVVEDNPVITRDELINVVHAHILEVQNELGITPQITREQTMDAISGRGRVRRPDPGLVPKTIRDLKAQTRLASHILDVEARQPLPRTGYQPDQPSDEQRRLIQVLNEAKKQFGEVITDPAAQLASYLQSRKTYYRNRLADLRFEIANKELTVRTKTPGQTDPELEALKAEYERTRQEHAEIFANPELEDAQRLALAERAAERQIAQLEQDLAQGRKTAAKTPSKLQSQKLQGLRERITQLKAEQEWAQRHITPPPDLDTPENVQKWFALDKSIRQIEQQIAEQDVFPPGKKVTAEPPQTIKSMQDQLRRLRQERKELRDRLGPGKPSPEEQAILHKIARDQRQIADYSNRLANRDFGPRKRKEPVDISQHPEAIKVEVQRDAVKEEFYREAQKDFMARRDISKKWWDGARDTRRAIVNLRSSFDFSGLRQGLIGMASLVSRVTTQPIKTTENVTRVFVQMFQAAFQGKTKAKEIMLTLKKRDNAKSGADKIAGIEMTDIDSPQFSKWEENARSIFDEWADEMYRQPSIRQTLAKFPRTFIARNVAGSNRAFAVFLNATRATLFDQLLETNFKDEAPTENELRIIGNWVNIATGRGKLNPKLASGAAEVIWAPKLLASRLQFIIGQPLWGGGEIRNSARARKIIAMEYARVMGTGFLLAAIASIFDDKKERDPRSSDWGKIVRGNTRVDIWGGLQQMAVLMSRVATGQTKSLSGTINDATAQRKYGQPDLGIIIYRFMRSKARPDIGVGFDLLTRGDYMGRPLTPGGIAEDLFVPLPFADIEQVLKDRGFTEGMILEIMNQFGSGVNVYEPRGTFGRETRTK